MLAVADHDGAVLVSDACRFQCVGNDLGPVGAGLIERGAADEIAVLRQTEMLQNTLERRLACWWR